MSMTIFQVDAFSDKPFHGNPAAVVILEAFLEEERMQLIAAEMNLSETAYAVRHKEVSNHFDLRWFTPSIEVNLCGHATLATAHIVWQTGKVSPSESLVFHTRSGELLVSQSAEGIEMDFPADPVTPVESPQVLVQALGITPVFVARGRDDLLLELPSEDDVRNLQPDLRLLSQIPARCVIVTAISQDESIDFVSRVFAPGAGIDEDPVTGSAHCILADYWSPKLDKTHMRARQLSSRGGEISVQLNGDRVVITGKAVTVLRGELDVE